jgi:hypothetical protein
MALRAAANLVRLPLAEPLRVRLPEDGCVPLLSGG